MPERRREEANTERQRGTNIDAVNWETGRQMEWDLRDNAQAQEQSKDKDCQFEDTDAVIRKHFLLSTTPVDNRQDNVQDTQKCADPHGDSNNGRLARAYRSQDRSRHRMQRCIYEQIVQALPPTGSRRLSSELLPLEPPVLEDTGEERGVPFTLVQHVPLAGSRF